jgi:hypothetical protein
MPVVAPPAMALSRKRSSAARLRRHAKGRNQQQRNPSSQVAHSSLDEFFNSRPPGTFFGNNSTHKENRHTRVLFQNIQGFKLDKDDAKQKGLWECLRAERVGISLLSEMNVNWKSVRRGLSWFDQIRAFATHSHYSSVAYYEHREIPTSSMFQYGGCTATLLGKVAHAARSSGKDPTGLGRFTWVRIRGRARQNIEDEMDGVPRLGSRDLVVVSAYRPNKESVYTGSIWQQQRNYWTDRAEEMEPRAKFTADLKALISNWRTEGCEVIVGIDANEDVSRLAIGSFRHHMQEVGNLTPTPIDGIFVSDGVSIKASGYLEFQQYFQSDHRGLWIDIDLKATLGGYRPSRPSFVPRRLQTSDQRVVLRYLKAAEDGYRTYNIPARLNELTHEVDTQQRPMTLQQQLVFNKIHQQAYTVRRVAERKCRKLAMGGVPWSPHLQKKWDRLELYKLLLKGYQNVRTSSRLVRRLLKKTGLFNAWKLSEVDLQFRVEEERKAYYKAKRQDALELRQAHVKVSSATRKPASKRSSRAKARHARCQRMQQKEETRRRRKAQGKGFSGGLAKIQVERLLPDGSSEWITCSSKKLVEEGCMRENRARYDQTRTPLPTPPMSEPLYSLFNGGNAEANSHALLAGSFEFESPDPILHAFLNNCRRPSRVTEVPSSVSLEDHRYFWSKMPENKGSEPHGLHNGHFKAAISSDILSACDAAIRHLPFTTGFVPAQWRHLLNFAIEKKPGNIRVADMRTIQLMNSEMQANNKKIGKTGMKNAEEHMIIPQGQHGCRKEHQAIDLAMTKRWTWDLLILQRRASGWISNDAKSCFDRIVHWVAIISLMRFGIQWNAHRSMFDNLNK